MTKNLGIPISSLLEKSIELVVSPLNHLEHSVRTMLSLAENMP